jgi:hypothetical protein
MKTGKMNTSKMKTSINLKTRKMKNNYLKLGMMAAVMLSASIGFAQTTDATDTGLNKAAGAGESIKVIDNKGTIKYLQTNNGITSITSTNSGNKTTTTWQLGGTLTSATTITTDGTNTLAIAGLEVEVGNAEIAGGAAGYALVVQDGAGKLKKLLAADILAGAAITGIRLEDTQGLDATTDVAITVTGLPVLDAGTSASKLSVYRNGVKLRFGSDFVATADVVTINYNAADLPMYAGDIIEIQYLK